MLSACVGDEALRSTTPISDLEPVANPGHDWILDLEDDRARLAYGRLRTDDVLLSIECQRGSSALELTAGPGLSPHPGILLESGGETETLTASLEEDPLHDRPLLKTTAEARTPVFLRFRRLGWLAVWDGDRRSLYAAHPGSGPKVQRFFDLCG